MASTADIQEEFRILSKTYDKPKEELSSRNEIAWMLGIVAEEMEELHLHIGSRIYVSNKTDIEEAYQEALDLMVEFMSVDDMLEWNDICIEITQFSLVDAVSRGITENEHWKQSLITTALALHMREHLMPFHFNTLSQPIRSLNVSLRKRKSR